MRSSRPAELFVHPAEDWDARQAGLTGGENKQDRLPYGEALLCILTVAALSWAVIAWIIL